MRLFAALEIPDEVKGGLQDWWCEARCGLDAEVWRVVAPHLWHVTLAFYGEVRGREADDLAEGLAECANNSPLMYLQTGGFGIFPKPARPRVFWAGVDEVGANGSLKHLARCCRRVGHATVRRTSEQARFCGHVTLARYRGDRHAWVDERGWQGMSEPPVIKWKADHVSLFQSLLSPQGPQYRRLETYKCSAIATEAEHGDTC